MDGIVDEMLEEPLNGSPDIETAPDPNGDPNWSLQGGHESRGLGARRGPLSREGDLLVMRMLGQIMRRLRFRDESLRKGSRKV